MTGRTHLITEDGVDHGEHNVEECVNALVERCEDGYLHCVLLWSGTWTCEDCMELLEKRMDREEREEE
ncbi:MAG: hypothetical protein Q4D81_00405 [Eubacteriales bacterium]|nr:hypothetical protein [Eubacteriales bacterium]